MENEHGRFMVQICPPPKPTHLAESWQDDQSFSNLAAAEDRVNELASQFYDSYDRVQIINLDCDLLELWKN